jgi:hypothetical protein
MQRVNHFPRPFTSVRILSGGGEGAYVIAAMFTAAYSAKAERLAASCARLGLPYAIHEVPTVHNSISVHGTNDFTYTKPNFIRNLLAAHNKPVLYVDADCEFMAQPELIDELAKSRCDFAIYNWYADEYTDGFVPVDLAGDVSEPAAARRFYQFAGSVDWFSKRQLLCSGLVQFYGNSITARVLLKRWHQTIMRFPGCADDNALGFTFNNPKTFSPLRFLMKTRWLPKSYARISWWIYVKPIINHADTPLPSPNTVAIKDLGGRKEFYRSKMERAKTELLFPRDCILDTQRREICKLVDGKLVLLRRTEQEFWL